MSGSQREIAVDLSLENGEPGSRGKPRGAMKRPKYCVRKQELQSKQSAAMAVGRRDWCQTICSQTVGPPYRTFLSLTLPCSAHFTSTAAAQGLPRLPL